MTNAPTSDDAPSANQKQLSYHGNGNIKCEANYEKDELHGECKIFHPNTQLQSISFYQGGKMQGPGRLYDESGNLTQEAHYENDLMHGIANVYQDGLLQISAMYSQGKKNGPMTFYAPNGNIKQILNYENDVQTGEGLVYDENNGEILQKNDYVKGKKHGKAYIYFPNSQGKIYEEATYENDLQEGFVYRHYPNGNMSEIVEYKKGKATGAPVKFTPDGTPMDNMNKPLPKKQ